MHRAHMIWLLVVITFDVVHSCVSCPIVPTVALYTSALLIMPPKRALKRPAAALDEDAATLHRSLVQYGTSAGLVEAMSALNDSGWLTPAAMARMESVGTRRRLLTAKLSHSTASTPYGRLVQQHNIDHPKLKYWEFIHPMALLWYVCQLSSKFAAMFCSCVRPGVPLRLLIYVDEICPGNPLRHMIAHRPCPTSWISN